MGSVWGVAEDLVTPGMPTKKTPAPRTHKFKPTVFQNVVSVPAKSVLPANMLERRILPLSPLYQACWIRNTGYATKPSLF